MVYSIPSQTRHTMKKLALAALIVVPAAGLLALRPRITFFFEALMRLCTKAEDVSAVVSAT